MGSKFVQKAAVLLLLSSLSVAARFTEQLTVAGGGCKEAFFAQLGHSFRYQAYISSASDLVGCIRSGLQWTRESVVRTLPSSTRFPCRLSKLFVHGDCVTSRSNIFGVQLIRCTSCRPVGNAMPSTCRSVFLHGKSSARTTNSKSSISGALCRQCRCIREQPCDLQVRQTAM